jgi:hypothetical protein
MLPKPKVLSGWQQKAIACPSCEARLVPIPARNEAGVVDGFVSACGSCGQGYYIGAEEFVGKEEAERIRTNPPAYPAGSCKCGKH